MHGQLSEVAFKKRRVREEAALEAFLAERMAFHEQCPDNRVPVLPGSAASSLIFTQLFKL